MKRISDKVKCRKAGGRYEVYIQRNSIDSFGKLYTENKVWGSYPNRELCEEASINDIQSMINCGYAVINGYRNGIAV